MSLDWKLSIPPVYIQLKDCDTSCLLLFRPVLSWLVWIDLCWLWLLAWSCNSHIICLPSKFSLGCPEHMIPALKDILRSITTVLKCKEHFMPTLQEYAILGTLAGLCTRSLQLEKEKKTFSTFSAYKLPCQKHRLTLSCAYSDTVGNNWADSPRSMLPIYRELIAAGLRIWVFRYFLVPLLSCEIFINELLNGSNVLRKCSQTLLKWYPLSYPCIFSTALFHNVSMLRFVFVEWSLSISSVEKWWFSLLTSYKIVTFFEGLKGSTPIHNTPPSPNREREKKGPKK